VEAGGLRVRVMVWGFGVGDLPWTLDLEGGSGVAAGSVVVVGCGQNGRRRRSPPGW
jgi:hypothetical protein